MTTSQTIKQIEQNIKTIREYLNNIEYNTEANAVIMDKATEEPLNDIDNAIEFLKDYRRITGDMLKIVKDYYGDK